MKDIKYYKKILQNKSKKVSFLDYLKYVTSWQEIIFYKIDWKISKFPNTNRIAWIISCNDFDNIKDWFIKDAKDFNINKSFFNNFRELFTEMKLPNLLHFLENENSDYSDVLVWWKNCYLSNIVTSSENVLYSFSVKNSDNIFNSIAVWKNTSNVFSSSWIDNGFNIFFSKYIINSNNIWFSSNLVWCSECIKCDNLENKKYYINNKKYSKLDYQEKKKKILKNKDFFYNYYLKLINKSKSFNSKNTNWNFILNWEDIENWYFISDTKNGKNIMFWWWNSENINNYNVFTWWSWKNIDIYWTMWSWMWNENIYNSIHIAYWNNIYYSYYLTNCSYCIWCIWLKNKSYCILNKQYTKEEWEKLAVQIFEQMENDWTLWDFFPWELNPFYFNDTVAGLIGWFKKEDVEKDWYMWRDEEIKIDIPEWVEVIKTTDLDKYQWFDSDWNWRINPEILKLVIVDEKGNYYRIVKMEYDFLVKHGLPLPRIHWLDRIKLGFGV